MTKREKRVQRELRRHGTAHQGHGWAAKQAAKRGHNRTKHDAWSGRGHK